MPKATLCSVVLSAVTLLIAPASRAADAPAAPAASAASPAPAGQAAPASKGEPRSLSVDELATKIDAAKKTKVALAIFDANSDDTRAKKGMIPTAILLPSSSAYDLALLPKNKATDLVFYCASEHCGASTAAAKKALSAGYTSVHVLPAGIAGWVSAGKATEKVKPADAKALQG